MDGAAMLYILFAICAGAATTLQNSINGLMTPIIGSMCVSCINFTVQAILILGYLAIFQRRLPAVRRVPLPYYASGILATIVVGLIGMCVARMGSAVTTCCSVAGQILMSALIDHFGLFGAQRVRFHLSRAPGFLCILAGVLCINLIGASGKMEAPLPLLLLTILLGGCAVFVRTMNARVARITGSVIDGGFVNSIGGSIGGLLLTLAISGSRMDFSAFGRVPAVYYCAGCFGLACLMLSILAYKRLETFYATVFMLIGQICAGVVLDLMIFHALTWEKAIGVAMIVLGVMIDKLAARHTPAI